jgi:Tol biopolymer transport system component/DNA-binding winged helix-turn-helix (wHTH) protein
VPARLIQFEEFSLDCDRFELLRSGRPIKLEKNPMELLILLASNDGHLVTRQEIIERLWGKDVFVDAEHGINTAILKIRRALRDHPEQPRFVLTVARKGYRFVRPAGASSGRGSEHAANGNGSANGTGSAVAPNSGVRDTLVSVDEPALDDGHDVEFANLKGSKNAPASLGVSRSTNHTGMRWLHIALVATGVIAAVAAIGIWRAGTSRPLGFHVARYTQLTHDGLPKSQNPLLGNDGSRIYFSEETDTGFVIGQVPASGGEVAHVPLPFEDKILGVCDISLDRTEFLLSSWRGWWKEEPLWAMPTTGGPARRMGSLKASFATWSPDGNSIFYSTGKGLYRAKADGSDPRLLLSTKGIGGPLRVSPDGKTLRFQTVEESSETNHYWEASADGSNLHLLFADDIHAPSCCGAWSAGGEDFFFNRNGQIWAFRERSKTLGKTQPLPVQLTNGPIQFLYPSPSTDGHRVFAVGIQLRGELMRYDSKADQFANYLSGASASGLDFSRDGKWVVYVSYPDGAMWRSRVNGSEKQQLLDGVVGGHLPRWSPDGKKIAFMGRKPAENWKVYVIPAEGGTPQLIDDARYMEVDPTWSPDGNSIAVGGQYNDGDATIRIVDLRTHKVSDLPDSKGLFSPRWSPDGRYIAALVNHAPPGNLMLYEFQTGKWTQLAQGHMYNWHNWSHDGQYIHFSDPFEKRPGVPFYRVRVPDGKLERVAVANFSHGIADADGGWWTGLAPGDAPICLRDTSVQEIYALELEQD